MIKQCFPCLSLFQVRLRSDLHREGVALPLDPEVVRVVQGECDRVFHRLIRMTREDRHLEECFEEAVLEEAQAAVATEVIRMEQGWVKAV